MPDARYPKRRRPAHPAPVERFNEPVIVQVNVCTKDRRPVLACEDGHRLCRDVWSAADSWCVGKYLVMPDHIHLFCAPGRVPMPSLCRWVEYWKSRIAAQWPSAGNPGGSAVGVGGTGSFPSIGNLGTDDTEVVPPDARGGTGSVPSVGNAGNVAFKLWQRDFWDTQMRSREQYEEKLAYVRLNPVRKGLARTAEDWPYQGRLFPIGWM